MRRRRSALALQWGRGGTAFTFHTWTAATLTDADSDHLREVTDSQELQCSRKPFGAQAHGPTAGSMGCHRCMECGQKFEGWEAYQYAAERSDFDTSDAESVEGDYDTCPACLQKERAQKQKDVDLARFKQEAEMEKKKRLKAENFSF